jgi:hypothetical protein
MDGYLSHFVGQREMSHEAMTKLTVTTMQQHSVTAEEFGCGGRTGSGRQGGAAP